MGKIKSERHQVDMLSADIDKLMNDMIPLCNEADLNVIFYATMSIAFIYARSASGPDGEPAPSRKLIKQHLHRVLDDVMSKLTDEDVHRNIIRTH
jgi:hypothetical protein